MNDERWQDLKDKIETRFGNFQTRAKESFLEDDLGKKIPVITESLEFESPLGYIKIDRVSHNKIIETKSYYHKGSGSANREFVVSENEKTYKINVFKRNEFGDWEPLNLPPEKISL